MCVHKFPDEDNNGETDDKNIDPFDPKRLRIPQRFSERLIERKIVSVVQVRKPNRQEFVRVHPSPDMRLEALVLDFKAEGTTYLVDPEIAVAITGETTAKVLHLATTREGALLLWPIRLPDEQGNLDSWNSAAQQGAKTAETNWVRIAANKAAGTYDVFEALDQHAEPEWPAMEFARLLEMGFKNRFIDTIEHPIVRRLLGEF